MVVIVMVVIVVMVRWCDGGYGGDDGYIGALHISMYIQHIRIYVYTVHTQYVFVHTEHVHVYTTTCVCPLTFAPSSW